MTTLRVIGTILLVAIFIWLWPVRFFTKKSNCYFYTLERLFTEGGSAKWHNSQWWWGYHLGYVKDGYEYHYDMTRKERAKIKGFPLFYNGKVTKVKVKDVYADTP